MGTVGTFFSVFNNDALPSHEKMLLLNVIVHVGNVWVIQLYLSPCEWQKLSKALEAGWGISFI